LHLNTLQFIKDNNLSEKVLILGPKKYTSLPSYYKNASLILFASSCENCPNIMLESMGSGNPVISSNIMPMPEFGKDAVEYFSPYSPESITSAIKKVILDKHYSSQLALSAYQKSLEYEWTNTAKLTWNSLMQLVRENKPN
jgi:glycosyltransferase involved in cell wall biosynthesis